MAKIYYEDDVDMKIMNDRKLALLDMAIKDALSP